MKIKLVDIVVGDRQREEYGDIAEQAASIQEHGLLQPIVVEEREDGKYNLIAGG